MNNITLEQSLQSAQNLLADFLASNDVNSSLLTSFGNGFNLDTGISLLESIATGETALPITVVDSAVINNANGAYAGNTSTIYLASELIATGDVDTVTKTLLEEIGHFVDANVNSSDAAGDEGAIFASFVLGRDLSSQQLELLQAEDDTATVSIDGETTLIEQDATIFVDRDADYLTYKINNKQQQQWFIFFTLTKVTITQKFSLLNE